MHGKPVWVCHFCRKSGHIRPNCYKLQATKRANKPKVLVPQAQDPIALIGELVRALNLYSNPGVGNHSNAKPILSFILSKRRFLTLVSKRKTILGSQHCTRSCNARTDRGFPSPRQFHPMEFMALGSAALQPLSIIQFLHKSFHQNHQDPHTSFF